MNTSVKPSVLLRLNLSCLCLLAAGLVNAEMTTVTNPDGSTTKTVEETSTEETAPPPQSATPNLIGPTGTTGGYLTFGQARGPTGG